MFNAKKTKILSVTAAVLAFAVTLGYAAVAQPQIQASVSKPVLRSEYKGSDSIDLSGSIQLKNGSQKISVSLRDSDVKQTLRMIADRAGLNVIFHSSVEGTITLDLVNVSLNDSFKMIMQASDLSFVIDNGTLIVMSKDASLQSDISKQNMMTIPVKFADSSKVADFLNSNIFSTNRPGLSNNKIVVTNPVTNELIIFGTENDYRMAQKVVSKLDVAPKTISFRVNHTTPKEMATLICQSLFPTATGSSSSGGSSGGSGGSASSGGAGGSAGGAGGSSGGGSKSGSYGMTGGAASIGGSGGGSGGSSGGGSGGSSSGGSSSSSSSSGGDEITLGEGKIACTIQGSVAANNLASLSGTSLTVTYFPQKGTINVIGGSESQAEMIKTFVKSNDKKQPQAYMEVQIVELTEKGSKELQNSWDIITPFFTGSFGSEGLGNKENYPMFFTGGPYFSYLPGATPTDPPIITQTYDRWHGKNTIGWNINYLITNGKGRLLANPKVIVTNGKKSVINLTSDYVKSTDEEILTSSAGTGAAGISRTYEIGEDNGISVELTPFISPDGYVTLNMKPNYATIKEQIPSTSASGGTIIAVTLLQRRNLDLSNIRIRDGETLVLGGLIQEEEKKTVTKFPILGDLPLIGSAFRSSSVKNERSELVIMVTPRIIKDTEDAASGDSENL